MAFSVHNHSLVSSARVQGTAVFSTGGERIGDVDHMMIDKRTGHVAYAVIAFGGFLGLGRSHYPLAWEMLKYDTDLGGYVTGVTARQLEDLPELIEESAPQQGLLPAHPLREANHASQIQGAAKGSRSGPLRQTG